MRFIFLTIFNILCRCHKNLLEFWTLNLNKAKAELRPWRGSLWAEPISRAGRRTQESERAVKWWPSNYWPCPYKVWIPKGAGLPCMHGYSSEYPKFLGKKFIYIIYNMYMYHRIANKIKASLKEFIGWFFFW